MAMSRSKKGNDKSFYQFKEWLCIGDRHGVTTLIPVVSIESITFASDGTSFIVTERDCLNFDKTQTSHLLEKLQ